jgi:hypothetical protein
MEFDKYEVQQLCYKSKRGTQTEAEFIRFMKLAEKFSGNPEFEKARIYGQALAMSEVNPSFDVDYWVKKLGTPMVVKWEEISVPNFEAVEHGVQRTSSKRGKSARSRASKSKVSRPAKSR